ncbi:MAG TPA: TonB-dependent receptor, partial [Gemmatimonadaceae bacterium]
DLATPSGATLRLGACPGLVLPAGRGAVVGHVHRADSDSALGGATVVVSWRDLSMDRATLRPVSTERTAAVRSDSFGRYRMCGLPTDVSLLMQVQFEDRAGSAVTVTIPDDAGVVLRHFSFSASGSRAIAALDSAAATRSVPVLAGKATLAGVVRSATGQPLADAQVRVIDAAAATTRTDSLGRFGLSGLPAGTQLLDVRRLGYLITQVPVALRDGEGTTQNVTLARIVSLDSIRVLAQRTRYREFENHVRAGAFGKFLSAADLEKRPVLETSDYLRDAGFYVQGDGLDAKVVSPRSMASLHGPCAANVVIDGMQHQDINLVRPQDVGAMEIYRGSAGAPVEYDSACGVIVIWTKR